MSTPKPIFQTLPGVPDPPGASKNGPTFNFSLSAGRARSVVLVLAWEREFSAQSRTTEIRLDPALNRTGDIWHIGLVSEEEVVRYGYRIDGETNDSEGILFFSDRVLIDPYCASLSPRPWGAKSHYGTEPICLAGSTEEFDWQGDSPLNLPASQTIIYELHIRGFTRHQSSQVGAPGTYLGLIEKIPYLKDLGITAVELLPITEWDETDSRFYHPETGEKLLNYWGYNPLSFFAIKSGLAAVPTEHLNEFKTMIRSLHQAGIEVILDLVFNHTAESDRDGTTSSFRGIDNATYYMIDKNTGDYHNFTGCGNSVDCNHPAVRQMIVDSLHYFVTELHVDGFRFDLAAIFSRGSEGEILENAPLIEMIATDPLLAHTKIIAEAWDAAGLYQVGTFSSSPRWREWNGRYRDDVRKFMAGLEDSVGNLATRIAGSSDLYQSHGRSPLNSINFITSHDGFTLSDLVSYNEKSNEANGEQNRDGDNHNLSWNSGQEGIPCSEGTMVMRHRRIRTFAALLLFSQGIPMITAGDEFGRSQQGNNNGWCQDNELSWLDWNLMQHNQGLLRFFRKCIALRKQYPVFRRTDFFASTDPAPEELRPEITWQSINPGHPDWSPGCRTLAVLLRSSPCGESAGSGFYIMVNGSRTEAAEFIVPEPDSKELAWREIINSAAPSPGDIVSPNQARPVETGSTLTLPAMGLVVLQSCKASLKVTMDYGRTITAEQR